jgi:hypothetical protein
VEFLVDPGTYAYHTEEPWRRYFRGTAAHNTVRIDGQDQSQPGGNFMWVRKARARCDVWSSASGQDVFEGRHDGYLSLPDPVIHRRRITLDKGARRIVIEDTLRMAGTHTVELFFHCSERCRVDPVPYGYSLRQGEAALSLKLPDPQRTGAAQVYCGSVEPILGWVSRRFDEKQPAPTICWRARMAGEVALRSEIRC